MMLLAAFLACATTEPEAAKDAVSDETADTADSGASNDTGESGTSSDALTYEAFVDAYVPLGCALLAACDGLDDMTYEACLPWLAEQVAATPCAAFDPTAAAACLDATESATCVDATEGDGSPFAACYEMCG